MSSVINVRLNEKMTLRFVELYRDQRLLWDKEHEAYNKRADRLCAYKRIVDGMAVEGLGVPEVASKIKNIRSTYLQELKKIKDSAQRNLVKSDEEDAAVASPYVPKLLWFPIIDSMIGGAAVKRLYSSPSTAEMLSIDYAGEDEVVEEDDGEQQQQQVKQEYCSAFNNYTYAENTSGGGGGTGVKRPHRYPADGSPPHHKRLGYEQQQSSIELFSKYIATSLETLPPRLAVRAQKDLHDVLVKYKLMEFDQDQC